MRLSRVAVRLRIRLLRLRMLRQREQSSPHFHPRRAYKALSAGVLFAVVVPVLRSQPSDSTPAWIHRSDAYSAQVVRAEQQLRPETATSNAALDDQITDLSAAAQQDATRNLQRLLRQLQAQRRRETDVDVREDLDILIGHVQTRVQGIELESKYELPYVDATQVVIRPAPASRSARESQSPRASASRGGTKSRSSESCPRRGGRPVREISHRRVRKGPDDVEVANCGL